MRRVLRIAFNDLGLGGIQSNIVVLAKKLHNKIEHDIVVFSSKDAYYDSEFKKYGRIFKCPHYEGDNKIRKKIDYYIRYFRIKKDIRFIIKKYGPYDAVHVHTFFESAPCLTAAKEANIPIRIVHSHNTAAADTRPFLIRQIAEAYRKIYRKIILKNATDFVGCSQGAADYLFGINKGYPIYNSVNSSKYSALNFPSKSWTELRLIHVGNFLPQKNQLFLVDIMEELVKRKKDVHLTMIGRFTKYKDKVSAKIIEKNLQEFITILPDTTNVAEKMAYSDYFIFPSIFEGFGNVMLEAQSIGLACFASTEVTTEVDCGLTTFIMLDEGPRLWANKILDFFYANGVTKKPADMSRFSEDAYAEQFYALYSK